MPEPTSLITTFAEPAVKAAIAKAVTKILDEVGLRARISLKLIKVQSTIDKIYEHVWSVRNVKTFWLDDREVPLTSVYHHIPVMVPKFGRRSGTQLRRTVIRTLSDFQADKKNILIEGTVGQGKSMLLRHLALSELVASTRFPVFVELRRVKWKGDGKSLHTGIIEHFAKFELSLEEKSLALLLKTGQIILLLDGFDEIDQAYQLSALAEIETLCDTYAQTQVIITSRTGGHCRKSSHFRAFRVGFLKRKDAKAIVDKAHSVEPRCGSLVERFEALPEEVLEVLTTPLLVSMLIRQHVATGMLPKRASDIYSNLFSLYFRAGDRTKPAFERTWKSSLGQVQLHATFCAMCFAMRKNGVTTLPDIELFRLVQGILGPDGASAERVVDDIRSTTLLVREGTDILFPHTSILDFHSARHIQMQPVKAKAKIYQEAIDTRLREGREELRYLRDIDSDAYVRYFELPVLRRLNVVEDLASPEGVYASVRTYDDLFFVDIGSGFRRNNGVNEGGQFYNFIFNEGFLVDDDIAERMIDIAVMSDRWHLIPSLGDDKQHKICLASTLHKIGALSDFGVSHYVGKALRARKRLESLQRKHSDV